MTTQTEPNIQYAQSPISYGFTQTFKHVKFWAPLTLVFVLISAAIGAISSIFTQPQPVPDTTDGVDFTVITYDTFIDSLPMKILTGILIIIAGAIFYRNALRNIDHTTNPANQPPTFHNWLHDIRWKNYILATLLIAVITLAATFLVGGIITLAANAGAPEAVSIALTALAAVAYLLLAPFIAFAPLFALDGQHPTEALKSSVHATKTHYGKVIGTVILLLLIMTGIYTLAGIIAVPIIVFVSPIVGAITASILSFVVAIVVLPAVYLAMVKLYAEITNRDTLAQEAPQLA